jgi:transcriptional regulator GlxA family with amidase domain
MTWIPETTTQGNRMTPDGSLEVMQAHGDGAVFAPARRVEKALDILRAHILERCTRAEWDERHANEVARAIVTCLRQGTYPPPEKPRGRDPRLPRELLHRALAFIDAHLDSTLGWVQIGAAVGLPSFTFGRGFKIATGLTPHQYVMRCRIRKAMSLLASSEQSIADIALEVGCSCQSHLTTMFRNHTGTTPGVFRRSAVLGRASRLSS